MPAHESGTSPSDALMLSRLQAHGRYAAHLFFNRGVRAGLMQATLSTARVKLGELAPADEALIRAQRAPMALARLNAALGCAADAAAARAILDRHPPAREDEAAPKPPGKLQGLQLVVANFVRVVFGEIAAEDEDLLSAQHDVAVLEELHAALGRAPDAVAARALLRQLPRADRLSDDLSEEGTVPSGGRT